VSESDKRGHWSHSNLSPLAEETNLAYYWIGFLLADGCFYISKNQLKLHESKERADHVSKFRDFIEYHRGSRVNALTVGDREVIPYLVDKFGIKEKKTYNPPEFDHVKEEDLFISMSVGFIDGDGYIQNQTGENRVDSCVSIKLHSSWKDKLQLLTDRIYNYRQLSNSPDAYINPSGYAVVHWGDSRVLKMLKRHLIKHELPVIEEKWNRVDLDYKSRIEKHEQRIVTYLNLVEEGFSLREISQRMEITYNGVVALRDRENLPDAKVKGTSIPTTTACEILSRQEETCQILADEYDISPHTVCQIWNNPEDYVAYPEQCLEQ
jgi:hypothetical protein